MDGALWLKALHIMAFAAWMAGMWYLPRLLIYHADVAVGSEASETFKVMERRLLKAITTPAMVVTLACRYGAGQRSGPVGGGLAARRSCCWCVLMLACHGILAAPCSALRRPTSGRSRRLWYRVFNEVPTLLFIGIVLLAVLKPF